ncbi:NAD(P)/FAD-dependent oxidoreductase [Leptospira noguchii]|uniref:NAD(P)/FAD-dependent oxidoreductase n=1 Tax=Leptospira noguchii TaxID=28182 RepID=UPI0006AC3FE1|nr:FAD-dependent oxidoreductase [Leptospira noguchii]UOG42750.1 FAD-dependent oxidoreductase [Leptospira noguchii]UOG59364.1 FAD-dependent oxidoreductase [Leptospira noguchii]
MILVIGSGIVGSWVAYQLSKNTQVDIYLCDVSENRGDGISGRNSGVLHSGIYYSEDSQKLKHCLRGYELSLEFLNQFNVPYSICGKIITTGAKEDPSIELQKKEKLEELHYKSIKYGIRDTSYIKNLTSEYPSLLGENAIHISKTGVVDVPLYLKALWRECENSGVTFIKGKRFLFQEEVPFFCDTQSGQMEEIEADCIVNAGGLYSDELIKQLKELKYEIRPNKGEYYRLKKELPFKKLVYPLPSYSSTALGVHYTFHLNGESYAGPNSNWAESKTDYKFQTSRDVFFNSLKNITNYYTEEDLIQGYVGLRPRLFFDNKPIADFVIKKYPENRPWIHLLGIESPGLTSSPSIGEEVSLLVKSLI